MQEYSHMEAARWRLDCLLQTNRDFPPCPLRVRPPETWEYITLLRSANRLYRAVVLATDDVEQYYADDLKTRQETHGRLVDISMPIDYSGAVVKTSKRVAAAEDTFPEHLQQIKDIADQVSFDHDTAFQERAREAINLARDLTEFGSIHLHAHLWASWIIESLSQAGKVHHRLPQKEPFEGVVDDVYSYIAHPPLIVATIGCTALIEEVGCRYIQKFTEQAANLDNTSCGEILRNLEEIYEGDDEYEFSKINGTIVEARNGFGHYIRKRKPIVNAEDLGEFIDLCTQCIRLSLGIVRDMLRAIVAQYYNKILNPDG